MMSGGGGSVSRRGRGRRSHGSEEVALQITSMADIFTILLVFLLKSYSVSALNIDVSKDLKLPTARGGNEQVEALKVAVTENGIQVEGVQVVELSNFAPRQSEVGVDGSLRPVVEALAKEKKKQREIASQMGKTKPDEKEEANDRKLLVIADKKVPYKILKMVLASASAQDYTDFKLVVVSED